MKWPWEKKSTAVTKSALEEARNPSAKPGAVQNLVQQVLNIGIDGKIGYPGAVKLATTALADSHGDRAAAEKKIRRNAMRSAAGLGFVTNLGGFVTMPVAIPANLFEFYVSSIRAVAAIAHLRGYDLSSDQVRTAALLTLAGSDAEDILRKVGVSAIPSHAVEGVLRSRLPKSALMMLNKAVGFRMMRSIGDKVFSRLGRAIPVAGGLVGGGLDAYMMNQILDSAQREFTPIVAGQSPTT